MAGRGSTHGKAAARWTCFNWRLSGRDGRAEFLAGGDAAASHAAGGEPGDRQAGGGAGRGAAGAVSRDGTLTDAGEVLREYAEKLLNLRARRGGAGRVEGAASRPAEPGGERVHCLVLLPLLDEFRRRNPRIKVTVQRALASRIADDVLVTRWRSAC